jgi:hypothetical protein
MNANPERLEPPPFSTLERDAYYWKQLDQIAEVRAYSREDLLRNWSAYVMRRDLIRFIAHYELFKKIVDLPGCVIELGVYRGASFFTWGNLIETFCPFDRHRKVYGFDSFVGLKDFRPEDGADIAGNVTRDDLAMRYPGAFTATEFEAQRLVEMHNADSMVYGTNRNSVIVGDIAETLPQFVRDNPGLRVSLVHFDVDLYEPTKLGLEVLWPRLVTGGVMAFDEYAFQPWPGESQAVDEFFAGVPNAPVLRKFPFAQAPAYLVKEANAS